MSNTAKLKLMLERKSLEGALRLLRSSCDPGLSASLAVMGGAAFEFWGVIRHVDARPNDGMDARTLRLVGIFCDTSM